MATVNFLAHLWGFSMVIVSLAMLINQRHAEKLMDVMAHEGKIILSGVITIIAGVALILTYNVWQADWTVLLTILGWCVFFKGITRLFFPEFVLGMIARWRQNTSWLPFMFLGILALGCFLIFAGFTW